MTIYRNPVQIPGRFGNTRAAGIVDGVGKGCHLIFCRRRLQVSRFQAFLAEKKKTNTHFMVEVIRPDYAVVKTKKISVSFPSKPRQLDDVHKRLRGGADHLRRSSEGRATRHSFLQP